MTADIEAEIRTFLIEEVIEDPGLELPADLPLLTGTLDSWALLTLIDHLEERYGVRVSHDEVVDENFENIHALAEFVQAKRMEKSETAALPSRDS